MTIIQITPYNNALYGLGSDGLLYIWNPSLKQWEEA